MLAHPFQAVVARCSVCSGYYRVGFLKKTLEPVVEQLAMPQLA
jgi:hypothetical protein